MKRQNLLYISFGIIIAALVFFLLSSVFGIIEINLKTHAEWEQNGISFSYRGSSNEVRKLHVEKDGKKCGSFKLSASKELFADEESKNAIFLDELKEDAQSTLVLVPFELDEDGDRHYRALYIFPDGKAELDLENQVSNPSVEKDEKAVFSECIGHITLGSTPDSPYEKYASQTGYVFENGKMIPAYEITITYYSETNIYCFSERFFNSELGELGTSDDDWLSPKEYEAQRDKFASVFQVEIP